MYESLELDILEEAVENAPPSLATVVDYVGSARAELGETARLAAAYDLIKGMLDKRWIVIVPRTNPQSSEPSIDSNLPPTWDQFHRNELSELLVAATPEGEKAYLSH
jgi:hypothetical protein